MRRLPPVSFVSVAPKGHKEVSVPARTALLCLPLYMSLSRRLNSRSQRKNSKSKKRKSRSRDELSYAASSSIARSLRTIRRPLLRSLRESRSVSSFVCEPQSLGSLWVAGGSWECGLASSNVIGSSLLLSFIGRLRGLDGRRRKRGNESRLLL